VGIFESSGGERRLMINAIPSADEAAPRTRTALS